MEFSFTGSERIACTGYEAFRFLSQRKRYRVGEAIYIIDSHHDQELVFISGPYLIVSKLYYHCGYPCYDCSVIPKNCDRGSSYRSNILLTIEKQKMYTKGERVTREEMLTHHEVRIRDAAALYHLT